MLKPFVFIVFQFLLFFSVFRLLSIFQWSSFFIVAFILNVGFQIVILREGIKRWNDKFIYPLFIILLVFFIYSTQRTKMCHTHTLYFLSNLSLLLSLSFSYFCSKKEYRSITYLCFIIFTFIVALAFVISYFYPNSILLVYETSIVWKVCVFFNMIQ